MRWIALSSLWTTGARNIVEERVNSMLGIEGAMERLPAITYYPCLSVRSDEGLTLETSAFESLYGGQCTLSTQLIKPNYLFIFFNNFKVIWQKKPKGRIFVFSRQSGFSGFWVRTFYHYCIFLLRSLKLPLVFFVLQSDFWPQDLHSVTVNECVTCVNYHA